MKKLLFACIALLCMQLLHASPTKTSTLKDDDDCGHDDNDSGKTSTTGGHVTYTYSESSRDDGKTSVKTTVKDGHTEVVTNKSTKSSDNHGEDDDCSNEHGGSVSKSSSSSNNGGTTSKQTVSNNGNTVVVTKTTSTSSNSNSDKDGNGQVVTKTSSSSSSEPTTKQTVTNNGNTVVVTKTTSSSSSSGDKDGNGQVVTKTSSSSSSEPTTKQTVTNNGNTVVVTKTTSSSSSSGDKDGNGQVVTKTSSSSSSEPTTKQTVTNNGNTVVVTKTTSSSSSSNSDKDGHGGVSSNSSHNRGDNDDCGCGHAESGSSSSSNNDGTTTKQNVTNNGNTVVVTKTKTSSSSSSSTDKDGHEHGHGLGHAYGHEHGHGHGYGHEHTTTTTSSSSTEIEINRLNVQILELTKQLQQQDINYNLLNVDFKAVKSENTVLQSKLNTANAETQSWKSQFEALTINFKQISAEKVKCEGTLKQSQSSIVTFQQTIVDIQVNIKKLTSESTQCKVDLKAAQKDVSTYSTANIDLNIKIKDANDKIARCQNDSGDLTRQNNALKTTAEDLKKTLATCQTEKTRLSESLKVKMQDYNSDERKIQEDMAVIKSTQALLEQCKLRNNELETSSKSQKASIDDLTKKITTIRAEFDDQLKCAQNSLNQCQISLTTQTEQRINIEILMKTYKVQVTEIQTKLDITIKAAEEANNKAKQYQSDSNGYKVIIDQLKSTVKDTNTELSKCTTDRTKCENNSQTTIVKLQQTIVDIQNANAVLNSDSTKCKQELDISRKETSASKTTIIDLNNKIKEATDKLNCCLNDGHTTALQIISIKSESDEMKKNLLTCQGEINNLSELLKAKISDYNKDELKIQQDMVLLKTTQSLLEQCETSKKGIVVSYEAEKANVLELTKRISVDRAECDEKIRKSDEQNKRTSDDFTQCKMSLKKETDYRLEIDIVVRTLRTQITEIQSRLDITIKTVDKANSKAKECEENSNGLKVIIDQLKCAVTDTNTELTKCAAEKTNCNVSLKESKTTIINLQQSYVEIQNINIRLTGDSSKCKLDLEDSRKESTSCKASNDDLNNKVKAATEKLSGCENGSHEDAIRFITLKSSFDELKKNYSTCESANINLSESLKATLARFEDDERLDDLAMTEEIARLRATESLLEQLKTRYIEVEESYESEKVNSLTLTKKIAENRAVYDESVRKYNEEIQRSNDHLNECKISLQTEIDVKTTINVYVRKLEVQITEITNQLNISIKNVEEANSKTKRCEIDYNSQTSIIVDLKSTLENTTGALTKCAQHSTSLQSDLTDTQSRLTQIKINFESSQSTIYTLQQTIGDITNINNKLKADSTQCEFDLVASEVAADECSATNKELNRGNKDLADKLKNCQMDDNEAAHKILVLKSKVDELDQNVRSCEGEKTSLTELLNAKIADYNSDEIKLQEKMARLTITETHLEQCTALNNEIKKSYDNEKVNVAELTKTIGLIRSENSESRKTYEEKIETLLGNWNECKGTVKSGTEVVRNLEIQITEITNQLNISIKNVYDANSKATRCEDESKVLKVTIDRLESAITDKSSDLSRCGAEKSKCEISLKDSQSTTVTLQKTVESVENTNKKLNADTEQCKLDLDTSEKKATTYVSTIDDLNKTIKVVTDKLTGCQNDSHEDALRIITLRTSEDELKHGLSVCQGENTNLSELYQAKIADYNNDEKKLQEEIARLTSTVTLLNLCTDRSAALEASYESTKVNVLNLTNKIAENRAEYDESVRKYTEEIRNSADTLKTCKASLQSETDEKESIKIVVNKLNIQITEIQNNIVIYQKTINEANSKTKKCVDDSNELKAEIEQLKCSLTDKSADLTTCKTQYASLEKDVKDKGSRLDKCNSDLNNSKSTITTIQKTLEDIQKINRKLTDDNAQYKRDLTSTQKDLTTCRSTNDDLNDKINDTNEKLKCCQNRGHEDAVTIIKLKSDSDDLRKNLSVCQTEKITVSETLKVTLAKFEDDERLDELTLNEEIAEQRATKALLDHCEASKTEINISYESVKSKIIELTNTIATMRTDYDESSKTREGKITILTGNLNLCETSLKSETDAVHSLDVQVNDLQSRLDISKKAVDEANANTKRCENNSEDLKVVIEQLENTVTDKSTKLKNCEDYSTSLQESLTEKSTKLDHCNDSLKNSQQTVTTLEETVKGIEAINKKLHDDLGECEFDLVASESLAEECGATNADLNRKIKDLADKLTDCESDDHEAAVKILTLKSKVDELDQNVRTCEGEKVDLTELLAAKIADYNNDELRLQEQIARLTSTQTHLDQCTARNSEIETSLEKEKNNVVDLTKTIGVIRNESSETRKTLESQIEVLLGNWNECKGSLKSETDSVKNLQIQITEITTQLNISIKNVNDANSKTTHCENESEGLKVTIDRLEGVITDKSTELSKCGAEKSKCEINLDDSQSTIITQQKTIENIQNTNTKLNEETKQCKIDFEDLEKKAAACTSSNNELKENVKAVNEKLEKCKNQSDEDAHQIIILKSTSDELRKNLSDCQSENIKLTESLKITLVKFEEDERLDEFTLNQEIAEQRATKALLDECEASKANIAASYEEEKTYVLNLTNKIKENRAEYDDSNKKCTDKVEFLTMDVTQCKDSLKWEQDDKTSIQSKVNTLEVKITEIQNSLDVSQKAVHDANTETMQCVKDSNILKGVIEELNRTNKDQSNEISRFEQQTTSLQNDLTASGEKLDHCNTNFVLSQSTIDSLQKTITDIQNINTRLNTDSTQCKHDLESSRKEAGTCSQTNTNLNIKITEISQKLSCCENVSHQNSLQIISLKSSSDELRNNLSSCHSENTNLSELLKAKIADYNKDEIKLQEEMARLKTTQANLEQCKASKDEIDTLYQTEKNNVVDLTKTIQKVRAECTESYDNCNKQIQQLLDNLSQCRSSLESESNFKATIEIKLRDLETQYTDIQHVLDSTKKAVDEANKNVKECEEDKAELGTELSSLSCTVNTYLKFVKEREAAAYQSFNDGINQFVSNNNIKCT